MHWKKILIAAVLVVVVLIVAVYVILVNLDINRYKPQIAQLVYDATGRQLTIGGSIDIELGTRPTLTAEDVGFANAPWSSYPNLARVKRMEVQLALLPLIWGEYDFARLVLVQPEVIVEFDSSGTSNFAFDTLPGEESAQKTSPPPLVFSAIQIEKGNFIYQDAQSDMTFSVRIDSLEGEIEGFDKPLTLDFKGAFNEIPLALAGSIGPIWGWVEPGYSMPANLTVNSGDATATITGELGDPINFQNLAFDIAARGSSVAEVAGQAGLSGVPPLGAFNLTAHLNDSTGNLAVENLDIQIGNQELVELSLSGDVKDVLALQEVNLSLTAQGLDSARLTRIGLPAPPEGGAFRITSQISDPEAGVLTARDLKVALGKYEAGGQLDLNLTKKMPLLTAKLRSKTSGFGPLNLDFLLTGPVEKPALKKVDLKLGRSDLAEIRLNGAVDDLLKLEGVKINLQARCKDMANLKKLTGQSLPVRGAFNARGKVTVSDRKKLQIPDLQVTAGKNHITGSLNLDLSGESPQLEANLSSPGLDLSSVLTPELAAKGWVTGLGQVRPVKLASTLAGYPKEIAVKNIDLQAGTLASAALRLTGSVENLSTRRGMDLKFSLQGNEITKLTEIIAPSNMLSPLPGQGAYALAGRVRNPSANVYKVENLKIALADTELAGHLGVNLTERSSVYEVKLSGPKFNLKPFPIPREAVYANLGKIDDLGPLKIHSTIIVDGDQLSLTNLDLQAGSEQLVAVRAKGSIKNLAEQNGIILDFSLRGTEAANLKKITGHPLPLKGAFDISGRFIDPAPGTYRIPSLEASLGDNDSRGWIALDLSKDRPYLSAEMSSQKLDLRPLYAKSDNDGRTEAPAPGPSPSKNKFFTSEPFELEALKVIDADVKLRPRQVLLPALALDDVILDILLDNGNLRLNPFTFTVGGGKADAQFDLRLQDTPPTLVMAKVIDQLDVGPMLEKLGYPRSIEGMLDTEIKLTGRGGSPAELMEGLNGSITITMVDGRASSRYLDMLQRYLGSNALQLLNPFKAKREFAPINCFVNSVQVNDGLANVKLLLDTDQTSIIGLGDVNLATEQLDLGIKPTPKKGHGLSDVGRVSFSLKELSRPFRLGGTLTNPTLEIDPKRAAFTFGKLAGALALGPAGLAAFFADVSVGKKDPCAIALKGIGKESQAPENREPEDKKKKDDESGGFFRRLFGR